MSAHRRHRRLLPALALAVLGGALPSSADASTRTFTGISVTRDGQGYAIASTAGEVYAFGSVVYRGNASGFTGSISDISVTANGQGYAMVSTAGQVYAFGTVAWRGNPTGFTGSIAGISVTADGQGYAAISTAGQVYAYGTVAWRGNPTGFTGSVAGISVTSSGGGYAAVSTAGQVYTYNVAYHGNPTGFTGSVAGVSVTGDGGGYAATSTAGQVYAYGTVVYRGNGDPGAPAGGAYQFVLPRSSVNAGMLDNPHHDYPAVDVAVPTGTAYYAVVGGQVTHTSATGDCGYGYVLNGDDGVQYTYCHGSSRAVASGARVTSGQYLGATGNTGRSSGPHLHFQIRYGGALRCPQTFLVALYNGSTSPPNPKTLPTSGCTY